MSFHEKSGAVLGLVLTVLFIMTLLATVLLKYPGSVVRQVPNFQKKLQKIYLGESAIIAEMEQIPSEYFRTKNWNLDLPDVKKIPSGPWEKLSVAISPREEIAAFAGVSYRALGMSEIKNLSEIFIKKLEGTFSKNENLQVKSGSRRFTGQLKNYSAEIAGGDLTLALEGHSSSLNFRCDGSVTVVGNAFIDTLRIYSQGPVKLAGSVQVMHLELYGGDLVEISRNFSFSGLLMARGNIIFRDKASMKYPAVAASIGGVVTAERLLSRSYCGLPSSGVEGGATRLISARDTLGAVPARDPWGGTVQAHDTSGTASRHLPKDSAHCLLPATVGGGRLAFRWSLE